MVAKIIEGKIIAEKIKNDVSKELKQLYNNYGIIPNITTIKIGNDASSNLYLKLRDRACKEIGINSNHLEFKKKVTK